MLRPDDFVVLPSSQTLGKEEYWLGVVARYHFRRPSGTFSVGKDDIVNYVVASETKVPNALPAPLDSLVVLEDSTSSERTSSVTCKNRSGAMFDLSATLLKRQASSLRARPDLILFSKNDLGGEALSSEGTEPTRFFVGDFDATYDFTLQSKSPGHHSFQIIPNREVYLSSFLPTGISEIGFGNDTLPAKSIAHIHAQAFVQNKNGTREFSLNISDTRFQKTILSEKRNFYNINTYKTIADEMNPFVSIPAQKELKMKPDLFFPDDINRIPQKINSYFKPFTERHFNSKDRILGFHRDENSLHQILILSFHQDTEDWSIVYREQIILEYYGTIKGYTRANVLSAPRIFKK